MQLIIEQCFIDNALPRKIIDAEVLCKLEKISVVILVPDQHHDMKMSIWLMHPGLETLGCHASVTSASL